MRQVSRTGVPRDTCLLYSTAPDPVFPLARNLQEVIAGISKFHGVEGLPMTLGGYANRIARINLTSLTVEYDQVPKELLRKYIGARAGREVRVR